MNKSQIIDNLNKSQMIESLITRNVDASVDLQYIKESLEKNIKLNVKLGIDPTSPHIHLGRAIVLWKLRAFQDLGCHVTFIIGDFTGTIGDTSDKNSERPMLTQDEVNKNLETYTEQALKILDHDKENLNLKSWYKDDKKLTIKKNSEWLSRLTYNEVCTQADAYSVNDFIKRDVIARRLESGGRVSLREMLYPMLQGYDSVAIDADIEIGGTDQWFNLLAGRTMQKLYNKKEQAIMTMKIRMGLDGRKMSSSYGNGIFITDTPENMYGKTMTIRDEIMMDAFEGFTLMSMSEIKILKNRLEKGENPKVIKEILAAEITRLYHGDDGVVRGILAFKNITIGKPSEMSEYKVDRKNIVEILVELNFASSKSNAIALVKQGGIKVNYEVTTLETINREVKIGDIIQKGKLHYIKII